MLISQKLKQETGSTSGIHPCLLLVYRRNVEIAPFSMTINIKNQYNHEKTLISFNKFTITLTVGFLIQSNTFVARFGQVGSSL